MMLREEERVFYCADYGLIIDVWGVCVCVYVMQLKKRFCRFFCYVSNIMTTDKILQHHTGWNLNRR